MKHILITGARSGIGLELVKTFAVNGWKVTACCKDAKQFPLKTHRENIHVRSLDVVDQAAICELVHDFGNTPLDVLLNCAGIYDSETNSVDDDNVVSTIPEIARVFEVNTIAPRLIANALLPLLLKGDEKLVATISSIMGTHAKMDGYHAMHWPYSASKAAVNYAMIAFATQYPEVKSVLIHPGWVKTKMGGHDAPLEAADAARDIFALIQHHRDRLPNGKLVDHTGAVLSL